MSEHAFRRCKSRGFSLIELMVTVAIVAVLAGIAIPSYTTYVLQAHRSEAINWITNIRTSFERCYSQNYAYSPCPAIPAAGTNSMNSYYTIAYTYPSTSSYTVTATAIGNQAKDTTCATFTMDSTGSQKALNSGGTDATQACWGAK